ncbi:condensation domain-containing protein [Streptomyces sp. NPDC057694]|uniref:condensation domain-containing protein n=1 Tax=Streptomyces sp. NPDC057694 TaxID=3346216 RepID=UPI0036A4999E
MTVHPSSNASICVVVEPGSAPYPTPWPLELHGTLDVVALEKKLGELATDGPDHRAVRYRLSRHGPDHHTLRLSAARGVSGARVSGCVADLLTEPPVARRPLTAAQHAVRRPGGEQRYEAVVIEPQSPPEASVLREALRAVVAAHPQLRSRLDGRGTWRSDAVASADPGPDPLVEGEFTDEDSFAEELTRAGRSVDARTGVQLRALLARDRRPDGPRRDRFALILHELAADAESWRILIDDVTAALDATADGDPPRPSRLPDGLADWVAELRAVARDTDEARHWGAVAARRGTRAAGHRPAPSGVARRSAFVLSEGATERITGGLARRLALTAGQVLTGVFALALAHWYDRDEVDFDVWGDPRPDRPGLLRQVGRLTDPYPVHLAPGRGPDPLRRLDALAGALTACAGRAAGGAGFGACRAWSPDPLLRDALTELPPSQACLILHGAGEPLRVRARTAAGAAQARPGRPVEVRARVIGGRLHIDLDWVADARLGDARVHELERLLREQLEELAALPAAPAGITFRPTAQQTALCTGGEAEPGTGRHVEQLVWVWHGPLDAERFAAAWQSVFDCETVLRTAFTGGGELLLALHQRVVPEINRQVCDDAGWSPFLEHDRLRGFDLSRPGALRVTLLETGPTAAPDGRVAPTRILLTYHRALIDNWSAHLLVREFYRAYLTGGSLPGGERRPDLRDYTTWVAAQDLEPARGFWRSLPAPDGAASRPGRAAGPTGLTGIGRSRLRLDPEATTRLAHWAGIWGTAESSVLQAVWSMLLYRASGAQGPAQVCFAVTVSGRGISLDGAARMPGPLRNALPMTVEVDPAGSVPQLLRHLRDRALDMAAYEWVPAELIRDWTGARHTHPADTVLVFEDPPHPVQGLEDQLAAQGIQAEFTGTLPARSVLPVGLLAHHDSSGALVLTGVHDRAVLGEEAAAELLAQSALLLCELPLMAGESTTVAEAIRLLESTAVPHMAQVPETGSAGGTDLLVTLRAAREEGAGTICLIPPSGTPAHCYDLMAYTYQGPQKLLVLTTVADGTEAALAALGDDPLLLLGGFSGAGVFACDLARRIATVGGRPPKVVLAGAVDDEWHRAHSLSGALAAACAPRN